ncbi:recombinase family protein [Kribbella sp. NPDC004536]|uniref:recombinase family protein n=1 Tax=Kribbella sp. NPDC004536 TaxID=3364106 RepID=UPI00368E954B
MVENATPLRAGVYGRESKGKQKSVDDQVLLGLQAIEDRPDWVFAGQYDDGSSASRFATKARKDWARLAADLAAGLLDVLVVWEVTRSSRVLADGAIWLDLCRDNGVLIYVLSEEELFAPRKTRHYDALARELLKGVTESNTISDRVKRGVRLAAARKEGAIPHGKVPYGFLRQLRNPNTVLRPDNMPWDEFLVQLPDPVTAPVVVDLFRRIGRSEPIIHIIRDLTERGIPGPRGGRWHAGTLRALIRNKAYMGKRDHEGKTYNGVWPGLVTELEWHAANRVLNDPDRRTSKPGQKKWLLSYTSAHAKCGGAMYAVPAREGRTTKYVCYVNGCTGIGQWELDEFVTRLIERRLLRDDARDLLVRGDTEGQEAAEHLAALEQRLDEWRRSGARGETSPASLALIESELSPQIEAAKLRRSSVAVPAALVDLVNADNFRTAWEQLPVTGQREVVQILFEEIRIGPSTTNLGRWSTDDDRLQATADRVTIVWRGEPEGGAA